MKAKYTLLISLLPALLCYSCTSYERADVMCGVTFQLEWPGEAIPAKVSYQIKYANHNTRVTTTRNSIITLSYEDELVRGMYTINVEGVFLMPSGELVQVRGVANDVQFLERSGVCRIKLFTMP